MIELDDKLEELILELYGTMHIIKALIDWKELEMILELEQDDDTGNMFDVFTFEDEDEAIVVEIPSPMGQKIFRHFLEYAGAVPEETDDDDTY